MLNFQILQGSAAMHLRWGGNYYIYNFISPSEHGSI